MQKRYWFIKKTFKKTKKSSIKTRYDKYLNSKKATLASIDINNLNKSPEKLSKPNSPRDQSLAPIVDLMQTPQITEELSKELQESADEQSEEDADGK